MKAYLVHPLPTFVIIGAQNAPTYWLRDNLAQHPQVYVHASETEFFTHRFDEGLRSYRDSLAIPRGIVAGGECTPGYMHWINRPGAVAARIDGSLPDVKVVAVLQSPLDRMASAYLHHIRMGRLDGERSLQQEIEARDPSSDKLGLISGGWYGRSLEPYIRRFGPRLLVVRNEEIDEDPPGVYRRVARHIGASTSWTPPSLSSNTPNSVTGAPSDAPKAVGLEDRERRELWEEHFAGDIERLGHLLGVDLAQWDPTARQR